MTQLTQPEFLSGSLNTTTKSIKNKKPTGQEESQMKKTKILVAGEVKEVTYKELYSYVSDDAIQHNHDDVVSRCEDDYLKEKFKKDCEEAEEIDELTELLDIMFSEKLDENNYEELTEKLLAYLDGESQVEFI